MVYSTWYLNGLTTNNYPSPFLAVLYLASPHKSQSGQKVGPLGQPCRGKLSRKPAYDAQTSCHLPANSTRPKIMDYWHCWTGLTLLIQLFETQWRKPWTKRQFHHAKHTHTTCSHTHILHAHTHTHYMHTHTNTHYMLKSTHEHK